ncbi:DegV family protein, partial [Candidatus Aminicenantes bacterium AC-334-E05]|nr:DegV family protein [Candidatus Aminicenantes bacterium AC-334-E05]
KIVVDSVSTIPWKKAEELGIELVPYYVNFEDESIREGPEFDLKVFYQKLRTTKTWPTTSHPTYRDIEEIFSRLSKITREIIYLVVSPKWTETYNIACQVREKFKNMRIELCDIGSALGKLGLIALEANKMAKEGRTIDEIIEQIFYLEKRSELFLVVDTLKYLAKGGRIGKVKALLGSTLPIKPIITTKEGVAVPAGKTLSHNQALNWIINRIKSDLRKFNSNKIKCFIHDVDNKEMISLLKSKIVENFECEEIWEVELSPLIGTHTGPGTWGVSYLIV